MNIKKKDIALRDDVYMMVDWYVLYDLQISSTGQMSQFRIHPQPLRAVSKLPYRPLAQVEKGLPNRPLSQGQLMSKNPSSRH